MLISKILSSLCLSNFSDMNLSLKLNKIILDKEKYFVEIIRNIQDYDKKVRDDFKALAS